MNSETLETVRLFSLPSHSDHRGSLMAVEFDDLPFEVRRIFTLYNVPEGTERGAHAHRFTTQLLCVLSGTLELIVVNDSVVKKFRLICTSDPVLLPPMTWTSMRFLESVTIVMVICDKAYEISHSLRDWQAYKDASGCSLSSAPIHDENEKCS